MKMGSSNSKRYSNPDEALQFINETISAHPVVMFSKLTCPYCIKAKSAFKGIKVRYHDVSLTGRSDRDVIQDVLLELTGARTVPRVFIYGKCIGGGNETSALNKQNKLRDLVLNEGQDN